MHRLAILRTLLPSTVQLLTDIYGSRQAYVEHSDQSHNKYRILEEACMMYDMSFEFSSLAVTALKMLSSIRTEVHQATCTRNGVCGRSVCTCGCAGGVCQEDPVARLFDVLSRISRSRQEIQYYIVQ